MQNHIDSFELILKTHMPYFGKFIFIKLYVKQYTKSKSYYTIDLAFVLTLYVILIHIKIKCVALYDTLYDTRSF